MNLEISTVIGCRMNCDYCPQKIHVRNYVQKSRLTVMKLEDFKTILSTVPKECDIEFAGMAEPFLNPECVEMVEHAFSQGYRVGVYTTLSGLTLADITTLSRYKFTHFTLHLPDADGLMRLTVDEKYLSLVKLALRAIDCQLMCIGKLHPEVEKITGPVIDGSPGLFSRAGNLKTLAINLKKGRLQCSACGPKIDHNVVLPNGDVLLCCMDYAQDAVIGNLLTMSHADLFESEGYKKIQEGLADDSKDIICRRCEVSVNI